MSSLRWRWSRQGYHLGYACQRETRRLSRSVRSPEHHSAREVHDPGQLLPLVPHDPADILAHTASTQRMELAVETDVLALGLDAANSIKARDSTEQMLMHQAAAAHKPAMRFMAKADHQLSQVDTWNRASYQAHSVEAARLAHAAGKLMGAFNADAGILRLIAPRVFSKRQPTK